MAEENQKKEDLLKIYVVDDSEMSRSTIISILEDAGYKVVGSAASAEECVANIKGDVNLFIIDVVMPNKSGIELAKILHEHVKEASIIMMSSLKQEHILLESISNGAKDFLLKPFNPEDLLGSVEKMAHLAEKNNRIG